MPAPPSSLSDPAATPTALPDSTPTTLPDSTAAALPASTSAVPRAASALSRTASSLSRTASALSRTPSALSRTASALPGTPAHLSCAAPDLPGAAAMPELTAKALGRRRWASMRSLLGACLLFLVGPGCKGKSTPSHTAFTFVQPQSALREGKARSLESKTAATLHFVNLTPKDLELFWLDFGGERHFYATIGAGREVTQATFLTHPWLVATPHGRGLAVFRPQGRDSTVLIDPMVAPKLPAAARGLRSTRGDRPSTLRFLNPTDSAVDLFWIDYHGNHQSRGQIAPHSELSQPTYSSHVWLVSNRNGKGQAVFVAKPTIQNAVIAPEAQDSP